ncbi:MAG: hypothetical protein ACJAQT_005204 [Akkermansiaceae bacterium]|jgi:hypothetical protein
MTAWLVREPTLKVADLVELMVLKAPRFKVADFDLGNSDSLTLFLFCPLRCKPAQNPLSRGKSLAVGALTSHADFTVIQQTLTGSERSPF